MRRRLLVLLSTMVLWGVSAAVASANTITVDGDPSDWITPPVLGSDLGQIARDGASHGEYAWSDATGDERTDFASPDPQGDISGLRITSDGTHLYVLVRYGTVLSTMYGNGAPMVQIAVDIDRVDGSGSTAFEGLADTDVASSAAWEYLVKTRLGSSSAGSVSPPAVYATSGGADVASGASEAIATSSGATYLEVAIPWANLGLSAAPSEPLRFTVAAFRATATDDTWDIGGAGVSNALDAVTNYGAPGSAHNTYDEVTDGVVDYHFDVWFDLDPDQEPASPLTVSEVYYNTVGSATAEEWVELYNATAVDLPLSGYDVGDEETPGGGEGMYGFPATATLLPGHAAVVAQRATGFSALYALDPDYELNDTAPLVPDMTRDTAWATGSVNLANAGDQVLLLDPSYTIVDLVTWGSGAFGGLVPNAGVAAGHSIARSPVRGDTDDCSVDFTDLGTPTPEAVEGACLDGAGAPAAPGTPCSTGSRCMVGETCIRPAGGGALCMGGSAVTCSDDGDPCTGDMCDPDFGGCHPPSPLGTPCADTTPDDCDVAKCDGTGLCDQAAAPETTGHVCRPAAGPCDVDEQCDGVTGGACPTDAVQPTTVQCRAAAGPCDVAESCDGTSVDCPLDGFAPSTTQCRAAAGACDVAEDCTGSSADCPLDGFAPPTTQCRAAAGACDVAEDCTGSSADCPADAVAPSTAVCRVAAGPCDVAENCDGTSVDCPADALAPSTTVCRGAAGDCDEAESCTGSSPLCPGDAFAATGTSCDDGDACTAGETCDGAGGCGGGSDVCTDAGMPPADAGMMADAGSDAGTMSSDAGVTMSDAGFGDAATSDAGQGDGAVGDAGSDAGVTRARTSPGCACRVGAPGSGDRAPWGASGLFGLVAVALFTRRRRRGRAHP